MSYSKYNSLLDQTKGFSVNGAAPINWDMRGGVFLSMDNLRLRPGGGSTWRHQPNEVHPRKGKFFVTQGTPVPLRHEAVFTELPKDSMFYLSRNVSSPECCPATFSTSTGCVCTDSQQRDYIGQSRGNNANWYRNPEI